MKKGTFLEPSEIEDLTDYKLPSKQIDWLDARGWVFVISARGRPKVLRIYAEQKLGLRGSVQSDNKTEPDFSHWITHGGKA